eukprot:scaffold2671_cov252-Pinguiococcus_pyrenoidosus.AAC.23
MSSKSTCLGLALHVKVLSRVIAIAAAADVASLECASAASIWPAQKRDSNDSGSSSVSSVTSAAWCPLGAPCRWLSCGRYRTSTVTPACSTSFSTSLTRSRPKNASVPKTTSLSSGLGRPFVSSTLQSVVLLVPQRLRKLRTASKEAARKNLGPGPNPRETDSVALNPCDRSTTRNRLSCPDSATDC